MGGVIDKEMVGQGKRVDRAYEAALGAVYPNILLDM
jgi:hypothetical protein